MTNLHYFQTLNGLLTSLKTNAISSGDFTTTINKLNDEALVARLTIQLVDPETELIRFGNGAAVEAEPDLSDDHEDDDNDRDQEDEDEESSMSYDEEDDDASLEYDEEDEDK